jgi:hypothetical protein
VIAFHANAKRRQKHVLSQLLFRNHSNKLFLVALVKRTDPNHSSLLALCSQASLHHIKLRNPMNRLCKSKLTSKTLS